MDHSAREERVEQHLKQMRATVNENKASAPIQARQTMTDVLKVIDIITERFKQDNKDVNTETTGKTKQIDSVVAGDKINKEETEVKLVGNGEHENTGESNTQTQDVISVMNRIVDTVSNKETDTKTTTEQVENINKTEITTSVRTLLTAFKNQLELVLLNNEVASKNNNSPPPTNETVQTLMIKIEKAEQALKEKEMSALLAIKIKYEIENFRELFEMIPTRTESRIKIASKMQKKVTTAQLKKKYKSFQQYQMQKIVENFFSRMEKRDWESLEKYSTQPTKKFKESVNITYKTPNKVKVTEEENQKKNTIEMLTKQIQEKMNQLTDTYNQFMAQDPAIKKMRVTQEVVDPRLLRYCNNSLQPFVRLERIKWDIIEDKDQPGCSGIQKEPKPTYYDDDDDSD